MELNSFVQELNDLIQKSKPLHKLISKLGKFQSANQNVFDFAAVNIKLLSQLSDLLFQIMNDHYNAMSRERHENSIKIINGSLGCLKIISRSKDCVLSLAQDQKLSLEILLSIAGINDKENPECKMNADEKREIQLEALRIICNCLFHSGIFRKFFIQKECIKKTTDNLTELHDSEFVDSELIIVHVKMLFLISALEHGIRRKMQNEYESAEILVKILEDSLKKRSLLEDKENDEMTGVSKEYHRLSENEIKLFSEILKTLFNISVDACEDHSTEKCSTDVYRRLSAILHCFLTKCASPKENLDQLLGHVAHMIVNIPKCCLDGLIPNTKRRKWEDAVPRKDGYPLEYELKDMTAIITLIVALDDELKSNKKQKDGCSTVFSILASLCHICRCLRLVRKYLRFQILPPLKDANMRPELSDDFKGRLVKMMTHVDTNIKSMTADFLFVLCKENADRLVKYTGYGNAAGLLASRGLMSGNKVQLTGDYSSDDSDSETEEYAAVADKIDIMTGAMAEKTEEDDAIKSMTDEEKQANAEELMGMIDRLTSLNVIKPMKIGADGRPHEISEDEAKEFLKKKMDEIDK